MAPWHSAAGLAKRVQVPPICTCSGCICRFFMLIGNLLCYENEAFVVLLIDHRYINSHTMVAAIGPVQKGMGRS